MASKPVIARDRVVGIFRGFTESGFEFHADLVLPYREEYIGRPMHGAFLLVELASVHEAVLGRITALRSEGQLVSPEGEDYALRLVLEGWEMPADIRERFVKYRVNVRMLGVVRRDPATGRLQFAPSHRRMPHVGSRVAFPDPEILRFLAGHEEDDAAVLGFLAMGEFVWGREGGAPDERLSAEGWMQILEPVVHVRFHVQDLVARRTFVFARAGYGKSNLVKFLFSELYRQTPTVRKADGREAPVGTIIFDREAEYFWPDDKGRPGLCDVPHLQKQVVVFTDREPPSDFYAGFVADRVRLDLRRLPPELVVGIALSPERQDQQNVRKLKAMPPDRWQKLVDLIDREGYRASIDEVAQLLGTDSGPGAEVEATAARSNMVTIVRMLHDPHSRFLDRLVRALEDGKLCVVDLSRMSGEAALAFSGIVLQHLFSRNQEAFVRKGAHTLPVIAVLEEAQSVLGQGGVSAGPYVRWVKEGRKYDLGAVLVTQQPGSIPEELLSQGDNWFVFHVLSAGDLKAVERANAHFSADLLASLLNEPIPGHCVFWSGVPNRGRPFPLPVRVVSFERMYAPSGERGAVETYARKLRDWAGEPWEAVAPADRREEDDRPDYLNRLRQQAFGALRRNPVFLDRVRKQGGIRWGHLENLLKEELERLAPQYGLDREEADELVRPWTRRFLEEVGGREADGAWRTEDRSEESGSRTYRFIVFSDEARQRILGSGRDAA